MLILVKIFHYLNVYVIDGLLFSLNIKHALAFWVFDVMFFFFV